MDDNWKHRSSRMKCDSCMWFVIKVASVEQNEDKRVDAANFGRCRRRAPTMSGFPAVFGTDWCGEHKLDENRIQ